METAFETLIGQGILGTFLILVIVYFRKKENDYKTEIKELNSELRASEKEAITVMKDLNTTLERLIDKLDR